jgi:peptidyl-tRNA hydrolase
LQYAKTPNYFRIWVLNTQKRLVAEIEETKEWQEIKRKAKPEKGGFP